MLKLTDEQVHTLEMAWNNADAGSKVYDWRPEVEAVITAYHALLATSPTHRIVKAPEGYVISGESFYGADNNRGPRTLVDFALIPKPCPAPKLEPVTVTVTVEDVYGKMPSIPHGYESLFASVVELHEKGFSTFIGDEGTLICDTKYFLQSRLLYRIGLRKWEGK